MERRKKKDILNLIKTMTEANDFASKTLSAAEGLEEVFMQCQDAALQIGTYLETFGETYRTWVTILEEYCENIYQMSIAASDENMRRKLAKKIRRQLAGLQNSMQQEFPDDRKEVVFLPYKASMWDSLESVWRAADEDPDCDAYVIPIPYYDKNPDGSLGRVHYEGGLYPKDVPVLWYEDYDFENRHPDILFIHNPYDDLNFVTSVDPFFYSNNLKRFTEQLVYIPYFILGEVDPGDEKALKGMAHFCTTRGVVHADRVVVQSEGMRQAYVRVMTEWAAEQGSLGKKQYGKEYWEEKILGLGSPKTDKVLSTKREELEIPEEWLRVIRKPDGSWKKVILYNTSLEALLRNEGRYLEKMREVFRVFYENREEAALLWRPHPLMRETIESMAPGLWQGYVELVGKYREEGWGIYDDTAELNRALAVSDGYYGDGSSLVQLCRSIGLPVMIQNPEV